MGLLARLLGARFVRDRGLLAALAMATAISLAALGLPVDSPAWAAEGGCADADLVPAADNLDRVERATLCLINRERVAAGRVPLTRSLNLDRSARFHSAD